HLILCNGLGLWVAPKIVINDEDIEEQEKNGSSDDEEDERLSQNMVNIRIDDDMRSVSSSQQSNENQEKHGKDENMDDDSNENWELEESDEELYEDNFTAGLIEDVDDRSVGENEAIVVNKVKGSLAIYIKHRWNSTYHFLKTISLHRNILNDLFRLKHQLDITRKQHMRLAAYELSSDAWNIISILIAVLKPFQAATMLISGSKCPTIGLTLFVIRHLQDFLQNEENEEELTQQLKHSLLEKIKQYVTHDSDKFQKLKFLESVGKEANETTSKAKPSSVQDENKIYRQLAAKAVSDETYDKSALSF
ncbi:unnamed protein product, partial [Didymodactylos carnosus]